MPFKQKSRDSKHTHDYDKLIERIRTENIDVISSLLSEKGKEVLMHCLEFPEKLKLKGADGFTIGDVFSSYAPVEVVKLLLDTAKTKDSIKRIMAETHQLEGGVYVETFALAIATLRERGEDDRPYMKLAEEVKLVSRIV